MCGANMGRDSLATVAYDWLTLSTDGYGTRWRPDGEWGCGGMGYLPDWFQSSPCCTV